jgi:hypothetical protein
MLKELIEAMRYDIEFRKTQIALFVSVFVAVAIGVRFPIVGIIMGFTVVTGMFLFAVWLICGEIAESLEKYWERWRR